MFPVREAASASLRDNFGIDVKREGNKFWVEKKIRYEKPQ